MLSRHKASGLLAVFATLAPLTAGAGDSPIPVPLGTVLWHERQSALCELSIAKKSELESMFCTCGLWQLPHSTLPLMSVTLPVVSCVVAGLALNEGHKSEAGWSGVIKLKGCVDCRFVPRSAGVFAKLPVIATCPYGVSVPSATVPSWQLRHSVLFEPSGGDVVVLFTIVVLV
jgi:hypothetical protein